MREKGCRVRKPRVYAVDPCTASESPLGTLFALVQLNQLLGAAAARDGSAEHLSAIVATLCAVGTGELELDQVLAFAVERARLVASCSAAAIALREGEAYVCCTRVGVNAPAIGATLDPQSGISGECVRTGNVLQCHDTENDLRVDASVCRRLGARSVVAAPIFEQRKVVGVLELYATQPRTFDEREVDLLRLLAALITHALQNEHASPDTVSELPLAVEDRAPTTELLTTAATGDTLAKPFTVAVRYSRREMATISALAAVSLLSVLVAATVIRNREQSVQSPVVAALPTQEDTAIAEVDLPALPSQNNQIEYRSHPDFTAVKIRLDRLIPFKSERLRNPERIYFDFMDSNLAAELRASKKQVIKIDDRYISQVRVTQTNANFTRIVLDLKCRCEYASLLPDREPYELSIVVQPPRQAQMKAGGVSGPGGR